MSLLILVERVQSIVEGPATRWLRRRGGPQLGGGALCPS